MSNNQYEELSEAIIAGKNDRSAEITQELLDAGEPAKKILDEGLMPGMNVVGKRFRENIIFVPEVLISARAMKASMSLLEPILSEANVKETGTIILGTVKGDIHDIGKNIVGMMMKGAGFKVIDLGINVPPEKFVEAAKKEQPDIIGLSALLTTTMGGMKTVIEQVRHADLDTKVLIGGAPITPEFAEQIGADGFAKNATDAVDRARELINSQLKAN